MIVAMVVEMVVESRVTNLAQLDVMVVEIVVVMGTLWFRFSF